MSTVKNRGLTKEEVDKIMKQWHDAMRDAKEINYTGRATEKSLINDALYILQTQIVPHAFQFGRGAAPNDLRDFVEEDQETEFILWNYVEFAGQVYARATGRGIKVGELFADAAAVLKSHTNGDREGFLKTLFGNQFVAENIGDNKRIYEFSGRRRNNSSPEPREENRTPEPVATA